MWPCAVSVCPRRLPLAHASHLLALWLGCVLGEQSVQLLPLEPTWLLRHGTQPARAPSGCRGGTWDQTGVAGAREREGWRRVLPPHGALLQTYTSPSQSNSLANG